VLYIQFSVTMGLSQDVSRGDGMMSEMAMFTTVADHAMLRSGI
jgi:hypothetical protein